MSRPPVGRRRAVTFADRISASGTAAAVAICLAGVLVAGHVVLGGIVRAAMPRPHGTASAKPPAAARPSPTRPAPARAPVATLVSDVRQIMTTQEGAAARRAYGTPVKTQPIVRLTRTARNRSWAFGTTVIPVPAGSASPPSTAFFLAYERGGRWDIALSGSRRFGQMVKSASGKVLTAAEASVLAKYSPSKVTAPGAGETSAGMRLALPWRAGQSWRFVAAFSGSARGPGAASMLAFAAGDGRVLAAGPGRLYRFCGGRGSDALIEIIHPDGSATVYYQLRDETRARDGTFITAGSYLGMTGTSLACGGTAAAGTGRGKGKGGGLRYGVVAFAVIRPGGEMNVDGLTIGGWTFHAKAKAQSVWAERKAVRVKLGGSLRNFGLPDPGAPTAPTAPTASQAPDPTSSPSPGPSPSSSQGKAASTDTLPVLSGVGEPGPAVPVSGSGAGRVAVRRGT